MIFKNSCFNFADSSLSQMELEAAHRPTTDKNGNYDQDDHKDPTDASCEDLLKYVKEKLDKFEMENSTTALGRRRRYGLVSRKPNLDSSPGNEQGNPHPPDDYLRLSSDPGPEQGHSLATNTYPRDTVSNFQRSQSLKAAREPDSEFDISGQTSDNRFPWQTDQAVQCDFRDIATDNKIPGYDMVDRGFQHKQLLDQRQQSLRSM